VYNTLLGIEPYVSGSYYVGYRIGDQEIGLDPNGHQQGMTGPYEYFQVADIHQALQALLEAGATLHLGVKDVGGGRLIARVKDPDGNIISLMQ
jgi:predicted enzyme related to lactoylglutathione lyase